MEKSGKPSPLDDCPREMKEPDYDLWGAKDLWTDSEAAALLMGWEPAADEMIPPGPDRDRFHVVRKKLRRDTGKTTTHFNYTVEHGHQYYPWVVIEWAESSPVSFPGKLKTAVIDAWPSHFRTGAHIAERNFLKQQIAELKSDLEKKSHEAQPQYMKSEHELFAPELEAAVSAWIEIFGQKRIDKSRGAKDQLESWLQAHRDRPLSGGDPFSDKAIERITAVATPKQMKAGGRPPNRN